jgi:hypothetical protein
MNINPNILIKEKLYMSTVEQYNNLYIIEIKKFITEYIEVIKNSLTLDLINIEINSDDLLFGIKFGKIPNDVCNDIILYLCSPGQILCGDFTIDINYMESIIHLTIVRN